MVKYIYINRCLMYLYIMYYVFMTYVYIYLFILICSNCLSFCLTILPFILGYFPSFFYYNDRYIIKYLSQNNTRKYEFYCTISGAASS